MPTSPRRTARTHVAARSTPTRRPKARTVVLASALSIAAAIVIALILDQPATQSTAEPVTPVARARTFIAYTACMLTERDATQDKAAAAVWAGMQAAADTTHAQITSLTMQGPDTAANADIYINTLALRGCSMVVSVGRIPAQGALQRAAYWPATTVVAIPGVPSALPTTKAPHNLVWAQDTTNKAMTSKIQGLLTAASRAASS